MRAGRVQKAGMHDAGIASRLLQPEAIIFFEQNNVLATALQKSIGNAQTQNAASDDGDGNFVRHSGTPIELKPKALALAWAFAIRLAPMPLF